MLAAAILLKQPELTRQEQIDEISPTKEVKKRIIALGDISCAPEKVVPDQCKGKEVVEAIKKAQPDMVLLLGDLQYDKGEPVNFQTAFAPLLKDLKGISYAVPGNHEYYTQDAAGYYDYWGDPAHSGERGKGYYSFNFNKWHIIGLNTNCEYVPCSAGSDQAQWLKNDLAANANASTKCTIAMWHHPNLTSGRYHTDRTRKNSDLFWQELDNAGADIVLNGHDHLYERFAPRHVPNTLSKSQGVRQFTVGTGGKSPLYPPVTYEPGSEKTMITHGFLQLDISSIGYHWSFIKYSGEVLDKGYTACS